VTCVIRKGLHDQERLLRTIEFEEGRSLTASLGSTYFVGIDESFAAFHNTGA
jgi:hypothetical protein